jgi:hypothetical protein
MVEEFKKNWGKNPKFHAAAIFYTQVWEPKQSVVIPL